MSSEMLCFKKCLHAKLHTEVPIFYSYTDPELIEEVHSITYVYCYKKHKAVQKLKKRCKNYVTRRLDEWVNEKNISTHTPKN
jgi:hypothetical protein